MGPNPKKKDSRPECKYGEQCYQKNPFHLAQYRHPKPTKRPSQEDESEDLNTNKKPKLEDTASNSHNSASSSSRVEKEHSNNNNWNKDVSVRKELQDFIKTKFLVDMPLDFYKFWEMCETMNEIDPLSVFKEVDLKLVGPFEILAGKINSHSNIGDEEFLIHWRFYYDPPELQTVLVGNARTGFHIGYFRDDPKESPAFMVSNASELNNTLSKMGDNIFAAVYLYLNDLKLTADPFKKVKIEKFITRVKNEADKLDLDLSKRTQRIRDRDSKNVCLTFNKLGLNVPYDKRRRLGYRGLAMEDKELRQLLEKMSKALPEQLPSYKEKLQPVLTFASIANDECDFGTSIELGWNLLSSGVDSLNQTIATFLSTSYDLLQRQAFAIIAQAHMKNRRKGTNLSVT